MPLCPAQRLKLGIFLDKKICCSSLQKIFSEVIISLKKYRRRLIPSRNINISGIQRSKHPHIVFFIRKPERYAIRRGMVFL